MRKSLLALASVASAFVLVVACGGTSSVSIPTADGTDGATLTPSDGSAPTDAPAIQDAKVADVAKDAGFVVNEEPSPQCHDLQQIGPSVMPTFDPGDAPTLPPLAAIAPGLYVVKAIVMYGPAAVGMNASTKITAYFNGTREYYIQESGTAASMSYTLDYKVTAGTLSRTIMCPPNNQDVPDYQIGESTNGFTVTIPVGATSVETVRYEHAN